MAKAKVHYVCSECGGTTVKWQGKCPHCGSWNTMKEFREPTASQSRFAASRRQTSLADGEGVVDLAEVEASEVPRILTGIGEFDRVTGGGLVPGGVGLIGGDPGIGKSTLLLQVLARMVRLGKTALYVSGEESASQVALRAQRIGLDPSGMRLMSEIELERIEAEISASKPQFVVIDSIQTMYNEEVSSAPGSVSQVRESTNVLMQIAKGMGISIFIVGHVTKDGNVAGPRVLEHMVDTVLYFEGDRHASYRILRGVKNRFGSTNEIGVFEMQTEGLVEVKNPSEYMLNGRPEGASGSAVACSMEGTRPILIEIQALVCHSNFGIPRRTAAGCDFNRVNLLMAVLEKRARINLSTSDAYVNIAGGIKMNEPAIDLGITLAVVSSYKDQVIDEKTVVFGEVGLSGEVRAVSMAEQRVLEAKKLGFERVILPAVCMKSVEKIGGIALIPVENIQDAILRVGKN